MSRGYELPVVSRAEDSFDRWRLASEIWQLISSAPADWSVRIGVYGKWGEGKTSVLNFLAQLATGNNHVVVWFNPWAIKDEDSLWASFAGSVFAALEDAGVRVEGSRFVKARLLAKKAADPIKRASEFHTVSKAVVGGGLSLLTSYLSVRSETFKSIKKGLGERKLIVLIDDLDRSNPRLLSELLLSLREVLDLPGMSFVLAFDVDIVAGAVAKQYETWGRGEEFLEKIIDFPITLPSPSDEQIRRLLDHELTKNFPFIDRNAILEVFDVLPRNPRKLKLLLRHLWSLKRQIERHDGRELDWATIILWQLIKIESAHAARLLGEHTEAIKTLTLWRFFGTSAEKWESDRRQKAIDTIRSVLKLAQIPEVDPRHERINKLVMLLAEKGSATTPENFLYQINLVDRPHAVTGKEFGRLFAIWRSTRSLKEVDEWVTQHGKEVATTEFAVANELFATLVDFRLRQLDQAASAKTLDEHRSVMAEVARARELLESLFLNGLPRVGETFFQTPDRFGALWVMIQKWIHFRKNEDDQGERALEEALLMRCVEYARDDPARYMTALAPWKEGEYPWPEHGKLIDEQRTKLVDVAGPYLAERLIQHLQTKSGIASLWGADTNLAEKYLLANVKGPLWTEPRRARVLAVLGEASLREDIHQNAFDLAQLIVHGLNEGIGLPYGTDRLKELLRDTEVSGAIWKAATSRPFQYRFHNAVRKVRAQFAGAAESDAHLPWPDWLSPTSEQAPND